MYKWGVNLDMVAVEEMRKKIIKTYFKMWLKRDFSQLDAIFTSNCYYQECYGPGYHSLSEIKKWTAHQLSVQQVISWDIQQIWCADNDTYFVSWYFSAVQGSRTSFDGISLIRFTTTNKICELREFQSKHDHFFPYDKRFER